MGHGVFWGSLLVTFVASVMGKDQQQRLDQGKFGLAAGTSLGGLSGLIEKQPGLLVVGFVGSAVGGLLGWLFYLGLAWWVVHQPQLKTLVVFQTGGLEQLQKQLDVSSKENLKRGFEGWTEKFSRMMAADQAGLVMLSKSAGWEHEAESLIRCWLISAVDTLALVFGTLADKPQYQSRVTLIVYRVEQRGGDGARALGMHWISYADQLKPHNKNQLFDNSSVGFKVLQQRLESPYFTTQETAEKQDQKRSGDSSYRPFVTIRLTDNAILALDWPEELKEDDDYVQAARSLFNSIIAPSIAEILSLWPRSLCEAAGVPSLDKAAQQLNAKGEPSGPKNTGTPETSAYPRGASLSLPGDKSAAEPNGSKAPDNTTSTSDVNENPQGAEPAQTKQT